MGLGAAVLSASSVPVLRALGTVLLFTSAFSCTHDAMHGSLSRRVAVNEWAVSLGGALMGMSGTATRLLHLHHHARPLSADDLEGAGARLSFWSALLVGPRSLIEMPVHAWRRARPSRRGRMALEWCLALSWVSFAFWAGGAFRAYALGCVALQVTMQAWASHLPHHPPAWLLAIARPLSFTRSPVVLSLLLHEAHHARPQFSCFDLAAVETARHHPLPAR